MRTTTTSLARAHTSSWASPHTPSPLLHLSAAFAKGHHGFMARGFRWILDKAILTADLRRRSLNFAIGTWLWVTDASG